MTAYSPPQGNAVSLVFKDQAYTAPLGDRVAIQFESVQANPVGGGAGAL